jgi:hypothetical protein
MERWRLACVQVVEPVESGIELTESHAALHVS